jgi:prolyl oligopeptidase
MRIAVPLSFAVCLALTFPAPAQAAAADALAPLGARAALPVAPLKPVTETFFGTRVTDNYRYMEKLDPATIAWMKAQGAHTRKVMDAIAPLAALEKRVAAFTGSFGFIQGYVEYNGRAFYEERAPGSDNFDLMVRDADGTRKLVDVAALRAKNGDKPQAINYFLASPDGAKVAVGISEGGSENASMFVYDARTGALIARPIDRVQFGATAWSDDAKVLYFNRLKKLKPGEPETDKYKDSVFDAWDMKAAPVPILGATTGHGPKIGANEFPIILINPGAPLAVMNSINGVQNENRLWLAPADRADDPRTQWKPFVDRADDVTSFDMRGNEIFLLSHKDAPTFKVLAVKAGAPLSSATTLVAAHPDRVIEALHAASDALYVQTRKGAYSQLLRIQTGTTTIEDVALPTAGHIGAAFTDPRTPGISIELSSWVAQPTELHYDPATKKFTDLAIGHRGDCLYTHLTLPTTSRV